MNIRRATAQDRENVKALHLAAFPQEENTIVAKLATDLLSEHTSPPTISFVAVRNSTIIGHVAFSPVMIARNDHFYGYILAPLAVSPDFQNRRIGTQLIQSGMQHLSDLGVHLVFVYGDPDYYGRFGFNPDAAQPYIPPYALEYPFAWQAVILNACRNDNTSVSISCVASLRDPIYW